MRIKIEFDTDNAAFEDDYDGEVALVLKQAKSLLGQMTVSAVDEVSSYLRDSNGNMIGSVSLTKGPYF